MKLPACGNNLILKIQFLEEKNCNKCKWIYFWTPCLNLMVFIRRRRRHWLWLWESTEHIHENITARRNNLRSPGSADATKPSRWVVAEGVEFRCWRRGGRQVCGCTVKTWRRLEDLVSSRSNAVAAGGLSTEKSFCPCLGGQDQRGGMGGEQVGGGGHNNAHTYVSASGPIDVAGWCPNEARWERIALQRGVRICSSEGQQFLFMVKWWSVLMDKFSLGGGLTQDCQLILEKFFFSNI